LPDEALAKSGKDIVASLDTGVKRYIFQTCLLRIIADIMDTSSDQNSL